MPETVPDRLGLGPEAAPVRATASVALAAIGVVSLLWACSGPPETSDRANVPDALLALEGAHNLRDLGGHPAAAGLRIKHGVVYRSDALSHLTDADLRRVADLDLRTVVDFRIDQEIELEGPDRLPEDQDIRQVSLPINPADSAGYLQRLLAGQVEAAAETTEYMTDLYATTVLDHAGEYRALVDAVLEPDGTPLLFHCTAGKDRAGIASALLLRLVGVPMDVIEADYLASPAARLPEDVELFDGIDPALVQPMLGVDVAYLREAFAKIDQAYGSFDAYAAAALGVDAEKRRRLTQLLTEPIEG